jgi:hypothetical protein
MKAEGFKFVGPVTCYSLMQVGGARGWIGGGLGAWAPPQWVQRRAAAASAPLLRLSSTAAGPFPLIRPLPSARNHPPAPPLQGAGLVNDHLVGCFCHAEAAAAGGGPPRAAGGGG